MKATVEQLQMALDELDSDVCTALRYMDAYYDDRVLESPAAVIDTVYKLLKGEVDESVRRKVLRDNGRVSVHAGWGERQSRRRPRTEDT